MWRARLAAADPREIWVYFNNDREGFAIRNARLMREELCVLL